jgi:hypothetical protein
MPADTLLELMNARLNTLRETLAREKAELEILKAGVQYQQEQLELERMNRALEAHKPDITTRYISQKQQKKPCNEKQKQDPRLWDWNAAV